MKVNTLITKTITLTISEEEARWLKDLLEKPAFASVPTNELIFDKKIRKLFWDTLNDALEPPVQPAPLPTAPARPEGF